MDILAAMRTFVAIVDNGSLTAAADALDRSQPAVVRSLSALESHLGVRLLQRTTRRMSLTPEGSDYLARARQILADVQEAERAAGRDDADPHGPVRMTAPVQFGQRHIAPLLTEFLEQHRHITAELLLLDRNVDLVEEGMDVALRIGPLPDSGLIALPCGELSRVLCASPSLLTKAGAPTTPQDLATLPCVRVQNLARASTWAFRDGATRVTVKVSGPLSVNHIGAAITACEAGAGFGHFLSYQVQDLLRSGRLQRVLEDYEVSGIPVNVVYPGGRFASARQRTLARFMQEKVREKVFVER